MDWLIIKPQLFIYNLLKNKRVYVASILRCTREKQKILIASLTRNTTISALTTCERKREKKKKLWVGKKRVRLIYKRTTYCLSIHISFKIDVLKFLEKSKIFVSFFPTSCPHIKHRYAWILLFLLRFILKTFH
mgnify:CR=1 FL=1